MSERHQCHPIFIIKPIGTGTQVTPSNNLQQKTLRLNPIYRKRKIWCCQINFDKLRWAERLHFANSFRHVPVFISHKENKFLPYHRISRKPLNYKHAWNSGESKNYPFSEVEKKLKPISFFLISSMVQKNNYTMLRPYTLDILAHNILIKR